MTTLAGEDSVIYSDTFTINSHDDIGERSSVEAPLPQEKNVEFTDSEFNIPELDITVPYSSIRDFNTFKNWEGEKHRTVLIWYKYKATWTRFWRFILQDRAYLTLSRSNSVIKRATRAGAIDVPVPEMPKKVLKKITTETRNEEKQLVTYVPVDFQDIDGELRVEGWKDGPSAINAGVDAAATTGGVSLGVEPGPFSIGGTASKSSISGEIDGKISDNTYTTPIESFIIFEDKIIIDSGLHLELYHEEIDRVTPTDQGFVIQVGETTYRAKIRRCKDRVEEIADYINNKTTDQGSRVKGAESQTDIVDKIKQLKSLREEEILSKEEFEMKKSELLDEL